MSLLVNDSDTEENVFVTIWLFFTDECDTYVHQRLVDLKDIVSTEICQLETQWGYTQCRHAYHSS